MPKKVDARDFLYRKVNPGQWDASGVKFTAFVDTYKSLSFRLASISSPMDVLNFFASLKQAKDLYGDSVTGTDLYQYGYRIAVMPAHTIIDNGFAFDLTTKGDEYDSKGHVDVEKGQTAPYAWRDASEILTEEEMQQGILPLPSDESPHIILIESSPSEPHTSDASRSSES